MTRDHERHNRAFWDADADDYQALHGDALRAEPLAWGAWRVPDSELGVLGAPCALDGLDILELGCGAAQWSIALADLGSRVVALDQSRAQLAHVARRVPLLCASGEAVPVRDSSFDLVFCDHGAMSFCEPSTAVPEVARLLRPGGRLVFCITGFVKWLTDDEHGSTRTLRRRWFRPHRLTWPDGVAEFQLPYGDWIRLLHAHGLEVEDLVHLRAPKHATTTYSDFVDYRWSRRWPAEEIWVARKRP